MLTDKQTLCRYLQDARDALVWKLDGLSEREVRLPRTPTGTNLLGLVKHAALIESGYFGETFDRPWTGEELFDEADPNSDLYASAGESTAEILDLYRRVQEHADATIEELDLDSLGRVRWWGPRGEVTLHRVLVHVIAELSRHAGHADILREGIDEQTGMKRTATNMPDGLDWAAYTAKLTSIADGFG